MAATLVYDDTVDITRDYLGPAADRFIERQVCSHLRKKPEAITPRDLNRLIDWIRIAISSLTDDASVVDEYTTRLEKLVANGPVGTDS